ncbi:MULTISPECIES: PAS domain-containing sensor histidine kinase [Bacillaceae]|uniref:histidine kinase n=1 Tax=Domibacillus aminovorans TaxID=29332 RepID=A0A177KXZ2_9BACI|nr:MULTISPECIES: PAS domain-containing sensor histidine kinase [Bacillaceae]OAH57874.1 hypothetical protein AWH48_02355 [Domibacillus aminovorans]
MDKLLKLECQKQELLSANRFTHVKDNQFEEICGHVAEGVLFVDDEWGLTYINEQYESLLGVDSGALIGKNIWSVFPEWSGSLYERNLQKVAATRQVMKFEIFSKMYSRYFEICVFPQPTGLSIFMKDIHDQHKMCTRLQEIEQRMIEMSENIREMFCIYTVGDIEILYISEAFEEIWGIKRETIYKNPLSLIETVCLEDRDMFIRQLHHPEGTFDYQIIRADGCIRWIRSRQNVVYNNQDEPVRVISVSEDITELKEKEELIHNADTLGAIGQLAAGIAHEIRNPMTAIKGFVQLWQQETFNPYSEIILSELARVEFIMNEFLMLAKPQKTKKMNAVNLHALIDEVVTFMRAEASLKDIEIKMDIEGSLPLIEAEPKQIKQVMINLIKNGMEAMFDGGCVVVSATCVQESVLIHIIDQGVGIPKEAIPRLGEAFYSNKEKGTGLGLMVSMKMIAHHNGNLSFTSEEGKGTKATITLPVNKET